ncbi:MAG: hypothetical protein AB7S80_02830 [Rhizobiaceae bacterium]
MIAMPRAVLAAGLIGGLTFAAQAADPVLRLSGAVNYRNFAPVAALIHQSRANPVVLDITIPVDNEEAEGHLTTFVLDGQFEVALLAGDKGSNLYADVGFELVDDSYYALKGSFNVLTGDPRKGQMIPDLLLEAVELPADVTFKDVSAESLEPAN